jgi:hypothetical protein
MKISLGLVLGLALTLAQVSANANNINGVSINYEPDIEPGVPEGSEGSGTRAYEPDIEPGVPEGSEGSGTR